ncbi:hypothetical protein [Acidimangrovimonas sediminis]|uniref:hypothetical protein n=1 Tax=Acidimangrovimonas sediminis TaxID=2056283 RepID=UPI000C7FF90E|nr:hypothetical protein [Acidimangrovimonas sediminis]
MTPVPGRLSRRIAARRAGGGEAGPDALMTDEDAANLARFEEDMEAVTAVLSTEIAAIEAGRIEEVTALYPEKAALLKRIEVLMPVVEPFLRARIETDPGLRARLVALKQAVGQDGALLARMSEATSQIVREIDKIRDRHSLNGLYGKRGERRGDPARPAAGIDKTL